MILKSIPLFWTVLLQAIWGSYFFFVTFAFNKNRLIGFYSGVEKNSNEKWNLLYEMILYAFFNLLLPQIMTLPRNLVFI